MIHAKSKVTHFSTRTPSAPLVHSALVMKTRTISPKAMVAMARKTPRSRSTGNPTTNAAAAPTRAPTGRPTSTGESEPKSGSVGTTRVETYAASEANPAWPRLSCPAMSTTWKEYARIAPSAIVVMSVSYPASIRPP
jgi:hypothetical protein